jgi:hypothetical protein
MSFLDSLHHIVEAAPLMAIEGDKPMTAKFGWILATHRIHFIKK